MHTNAERRHVDFQKAIRKMNICQHVYGFAWYDNLHQYSDNKIFCSCPLCSAKTGSKGRQNNWNERDLRRIMEMQQQMDDYYEEDED